MNFEFDDDKPIYKQLVEKLKLEIVTGNYQSGDKLPSVREWSTLVKVNPNTIQRALVELENQKLIYTMRTAGKFVTDDKKVIQLVKKELAKEKVETFLDDMNMLGLSQKEIMSLLKERKNLQ